MRAHDHAAAGGPPRLTPAAVRHVLFDRAGFGPRGYDEVQVDVFLEQVERELALLLDERAALERELAALRRHGRERSPGVAGTPGSGAAAGLGGAVDDLAQRVVEVLHDGTGATGSAPGPASGTRPAPAPEVVEAVRSEFRRALTELVRDLDVLWAAGPGDRRHAAADRPGPDGDVLVPLRSAGREPAHPVEQDPQDVRGPEAERVQAEPAEGERVEAGPGELAPAPAPAVEEQAQHAVEVPAGDRPAEPSGPRAPRVRTTGPRSKRSQDTARSRKAGPPADEGEADRGPRAGADADAAVTPPRRRRAGPPADDGQSDHGPRSGEDADEADTPPERPRGRSIGTTRRQ